MAELEDMMRLRFIYETELRRGPFPTKECGIAEIDGKLRLELDIYLANIAGIASHGAKLQTIEPDRRREFIEFAERAFWDRFPAPQIQKKINLKRTPSLYRLLESTEEARLLILKCLDS